MSPIPRLISAPISIVLIAVAIGCGGKPQKPALMASMADEEITVNELRARDYQYAARFGQLVSKCAMEIFDATDEDVIRERALLWRMYAGPQARNAAFNRDPLAGLLELWALAGQQRQYFTEGDGKDVFGDEHECVAATAHQLEDEVIEIAAAVMTKQDMDDVKKNVNEWIDAHPVEGVLFVRPTATADLAAMVHEEAKGGLAAVGSMEETFRDLNDRIGILTVQMPLEARWQAEYLAYVLFEDRLEEPTEVAVASLERISLFLDDFHDDLHESIGGETQTLLDGFTNETQKAFATLKQEREAVLAAIEKERVAVIDALDAEVDETVNKLDAVGRGLIDHFFVRLIEVLAVLGLATLLMVVLVLVVLRRRSSSQAAPPPPTRPPTPPPTPPAGGDQG